MSFNIEEGGNKSAPAWTPACPECQSETKMKNSHKTRRAHETLCVFKCTSCGVEYPVYMTDMTDKP